jgi:hypothetical protein
MIGVNIFSPSEIATSDYSKEQLPKWELDIVDYRNLSDIGKSGVEIFDLGHSEISPEFLVAKIYRTGTSVTSKLRTRMNNGDLIEFERSEIMSNLEYDSLQGIIPKTSIRINGESLAQEKFNGFQRVHDFDSLRDFYSNDWISAKNIETFPQ